MTGDVKQLHQPQLFYRITALWVICEAFAGGMMHAAKIPFTGMIVSGLAVCCIALLAWHVPGRGNILKATIIVAIFKLLLSPHSPPTAYIAVFFQGLMGQLFLQNKKWFVPATIFVAAISLAESAMQRLLVLWIVYGEDFFKAVNGFIQKTTGDKTINNYSMMVAAGYMLIHIVVGMLIGWWISKTIRNMETWKADKERFLFKPQEDFSVSAATTAKKKKRRLFFIVFSICLLIFYILTLIKPGWAPLPGGKIAALFLRSVVILLLWYFIFSPLLMGFIKKQLQRRQAQNKEAFDHTMQVLPEMKAIFQQAWTASQQKKGLGRILLFVQIVLLNAVRPASSVFEQPSES